VKFPVKKLLKGTGIYTISRLLTNASSFLLLPVFTRFLTAEQYGILGVVNPIRRFIPLFFIFGLYTAQMRNYVDLKDDRKKLGEYLFTLNSFLWINSIVVFLFIISPIGQKFIGLFIDYKKVPFYPYVFITVIIGFLNLFVLMATNFYKTKQEFKKIGINSVIRFAIKAGLALVLIIYLDFGALGKLFGYLAGSIYMIVVFYSNYIRKINFNFKTDQLINSFIMGFPIAINGIISIILNFSDRIIMAKYFSLDKVGLYSLAYTGAMVLHLFIFSFRDAWQPMFYNLIHSSNQRKYIIVKKMMIYFLAFISIVSLTGQLFGKELIYLVLPKNYFKTSVFLPYVLVGIVFFGAYHYLVNILMYHKDTKYIPFFTFFSAILNVIINYVFMPIYGPLVAAYSTIISFFLLFLILLIYINLKYKSYIFNYKKVFFIFFGIFNPLLFILINQEISLMNVIFKLIYLFLFSVIFYKEITEFIHRIFKNKKILNKE